jgi:PPM family protein phosphatase
MNSLASPTNDLWSRCLEFAVRSDVGLRRANNQDSATAMLADSQADFEQRGHFFMVADGMGAHAAGELASKMATDLVPMVYRKRREQSPPEAILGATLDANQQIHARGQASPDFHGMGTTATALLLLPEGAVAAHVGDSRAYRLRGTRLDQLTFDHSLVWELRAAGRESATELPGYVSKNIITRSLGPNPAVQVDLEGFFPIESGDTFLLCSDGLSGQAADDEIGAVLGCLLPDEAAQALVDLANLRGGPDNITVIVVRVLGPQIAGAKATNGDSPVAARPHRRQGVHLAVWAGFASGLLAAIGLTMLEKPLLALGGIVAAAIAAIAAMFESRGASCCRAAKARRSLGRGPYVQCECSPRAEVLERIAGLAAELSEAAIQEPWSVDWGVYDNYATQADLAAERGDLTESARQRLRGISFLMAELRRQRDASSASGTDPRT